MSDRKHPLTNDDDHVEKRKRLEGKIAKCEEQRQHLYKGVDELQFMRPTVHRNATREQKEQFNKAINRAEVAAQDLLRKQFDYKEKKAMIPVEAKVRELSEYVDQVEEEDFDWED